MLAHPSVEVLGHSDDVPALMRQSDILLLPSIEEGFGLVCVEAMASGCVPLVSEACTEVVAHGKTGLRHAVGDVNALEAQITLLHEDRAALAALRAGCLTAAREHTWSQAGVRLLDAYRDVLSARPRSQKVAA
jgi:glycosyltransferase involved in cell wall biosynthesis